MNKQMRSHIKTGPNEANMFSVFSVSTTVALGAAPAPLTALEDTLAAEDEAEPTG